MLSAAYWFKAVLVRIMYSVLVSAPEWSFLYFQGAVNVDWLHWRQHVFGNKNVLFKLISNRCCFFKFWYKSFLWSFFSLILGLVYFLQKKVCFFVFILSSSSFIVLMSLFWLAIYHIFQFFCLPWFCDKEENEWI